MLVRESLYNFKRGDDIISSSGLGDKKRIIDWLYDHNILDFKINDNLTIDVYKDVSFILYGLNEFPTYIKFNKVNGYFSLNECNFKNLIGCPNFVSDNFSCSGNPLQSLEGIPKFIGGDFYIRRTPLSNIKIINNILKNTDNIIKGKIYTQKFKR